MTGNAFLAVGLGDAERHALAAALTDASPGPPVPGKRQPPENWHVTLRFLGDASEPATDRLLRELEGSLDVGAGAVTCSGLGVFPKPARATVMYVAITDPTGILTALAARCEDAAREIGFTPEERPFVPHLTLSRIRPPLDVRGFLDSFGDFEVPIAVDAVTLYRTRRSRSRLWYEAVETLDLGGGGR